MASSRSNTVTEWPALFNWAAAARPAGPDPTTATFLPVRSTGVRGFTRLRAQAVSMIFFSISSMVTAGWLMDSTQDASQGAGQILPVNSGKLFVEDSTSEAVSQSPRYTASLNSGMILPSGQP